MGGEIKRGWEIIIRDKAQKALLKIPKPWQNRIEDAIDGLKVWPFAGEKMFGEFSEYRKIRVWPYRIVYKLFKEERLIYIARIDHRQGAYK